jgi:hypothetical protein
MADPKTAAEVLYGKGQTVKDEAATGPIAEELVRTRAGANGLINGSELTTKMASPYNRHRNAHSFEFKEPLCDLSTPGCTEDAAYAALLRFGVPGDPKAGVTIHDEDRREVTFLGVKAGQVTVFLEPETKTLINRTLPGHIFHDGIVQRQIVTEGNTVYVRHYGVGDNSSWNTASVNTNMGPPVFRESIQHMRNTLRPPAGLPGKWPRYE